MRLLQNSLRGENHIGIRDATEIYQRQRSVQTDALGTLPDMNIQQKLSWCDSKASNDMIKKIKWIL